MVKLEGEDLRDKISKCWSEDGLGQSPMDHELALIVNVVTHAILNPRESQILCSLQCALTPFIDKTSWDLTRFADQVKNTVARTEGEESQADSRLPVYFQEANFGDITEPATVLDQYGRIMTWVLPGVLHPKRLVC
jgi:hypothetical protein